MGGSTKWVKKRSKMKTLQERIEDYLTNELEPYRPTHAHQWAIELTKGIIEIMQQPTLDIDLTPDERKQRKTGYNPG